MRKIPAQDEPPWVHVGLNMRTRPYYFQLQYMCKPEVVGFDHEWVFPSCYSLITQFRCESNSTAIIYSLHIGAEPCLQMGASYTAEDFSKIRPRVMLIRPCERVLIRASRELKVFGYAITSENLEALERLIRL